MGAPPGRQRLGRLERLELMQRLRRDAQRIAGHFGLRYRGIEAERGNVTSRYGICYADGLIKVRLTHARTGRPLRYSSLIDTLCHELAHLRHFHHGPAFKDFFWELLGWARREGIYQPRPRARPRPSATAVPKLPPPPPIAAPRQQQLLFALPEPPPATPSPPRRPRRPRRSHAPEQLALL